MNAALLRRPGGWLTELGKLGAFLRRDFLLAWSYRLAFMFDLVNLLAQAILFSFVSRIVDASRIPAYGGRPTTYLAFVVVGIAAGSLLQIGLGRIVGALRNEQLMGTVESLFVTPTSEITILVGLAAYDLVYVPARLAVFLGLVLLVFRIDIVPAGILPALAILAAFVPFVWGLGAASAAAILRYRQVPGLIGLMGYALAVGSGAYFPLDILPGPVAALLRANPVALAMAGMRETLLGGAGWPTVFSTLVVLIPSALISLIVGVVLFHGALQAERRYGTLGLY